MTAVREFLNLAGETPNDLFANIHNGYHAAFGRDGMLYVGMGECKTSPFCDYGAIVGGPVYRGSALPELQGVYFFGDWSADNLAALVHCSDPTSPVTVIDIVAAPNQHVRQRMSRAFLWLRRHGYLDERTAEERNNETVMPSALDACTQLAP